MTVRSYVFGPLLALGSLLIVSSASAYCRTYTCDSTKTECDRDLDWCIVSGKPLAWPSSCVSYTVQEQGSPRHGISAQELEAIVSTAFDRWLGADCGAGRTPQFSVESIGQVSCSRTEYNQDHGNANIFMFVDEDWPKNQSDHALALTTLWFNPNTGLIYDVDVEINGTAPRITIGDVTDGVDLQSILTHEVGHFLGLSHSRTPDAVMRPYYDPGRDDLRELHADDIAGICAIYTEERTVQSNSCTPRHGFASTCRSEDSGGCSYAVAPRSAARNGALVWFSALALLGVLYGRRRNGSRQP